ncbi:MAG TPA: tetratricopeptide repeat protein [Sphingorhabdus sp.]|jgi:cytochrome c-type biogenesis protein CcmH/NrfG|nr:tetratricopeptide repeat protein [Sphingorhabdus sp.]
MSGWVALGLLAVASLAALVLIGRLQKSYWQVAAAAVLLGMTGYALQGRPSLQSAPAKSIAAKEDAAVQLVDIRADMDQSFGGAKRWLVTADAFAKQGDYKLSVSYIQAGLKQNPEDPELWSALGLQLMLASNGEMSPPAQLAFDKARAIRPNYPQPYYFGGLARLFGGDVGGAILFWEKTLSLATPNAKWKPRLESQLAGAKALQAQMR